MIWAWMETSRAETGSSQTMNAGLQGQGPGNPDALPLAAAELVRVALGHVGLELHHVQQLVHLLVVFPAPAGHPVHEERLADDVPAGHAGVQRGDGILEDQLHVAPHLSQRLALEGDEVLALEQDRPGCRLVELQNAAARRGLAAAAFPDEAEGLPLLHVEADVVHRLDVPHPGTEDARGHRKIHHEILDIDQPAVRLAHCPPSFIRVASAPAGS